jgi:hypothetical protein
MGQLFIQCGLLSLGHDLARSLYELIQGHVCYSKPGHSISKDSAVSVSLVRHTTVMSSIGQEVSAP